MRKKLVAIIFGLVLIPCFCMAEKRTITVAEGNGSYTLELPGSDIQNKENTTVVVERNVDAATITVGFKDSFGVFKAYKDGDITTDGEALIRHGKGVILMISISGITANDITIRY